MYRLSCLLLGKLKFMPVIQGTASAVAVKLEIPRLLAPESTLFYEMNTNQGTSSSLLRTIEEFLVPATNHPSVS